MKTLQEQYELIKKGKGSKDIFLKESKRLFPQYIPNQMGYDETVGLLKQHSVIFDPKNKQVLNEEKDWFKIFKESSQKLGGKEKINEGRKKKEENKDSKINIPFKTDPIYGPQFFRGYYVEMDDPKNKDKTVEQIIDIVAKNIKKDPLYYVKKGQFGVKDIGYTDESLGLKASKSDQMEKVKLKKPLKEEKISMLYDIGEVVKFKNPQTDKEDIGKISNRDYNYGDPLYDIKIKGTNELVSHVRQDYLALNLEEEDLRMGIKFFKSVLDKIKSKHLTGKAQLSKTGNILKFYLDQNPEKEKNIVQNIAQEYGFEFCPQDSGSHILYFKIRRRLLNLGVQNNENLQEKMNKKNKKSFILKKIKEIEKQGSIAALEVKMKALDEEIQERKRKISNVTENEDFAEFVNKSKVNEIKREIKELEKSKQNYVKAYEKLTDTEKKEIIDEEPEEQLDEGPLYVNESLKNYIKKEIKKIQETKTLELLADKKIKSKRKFKK